MSIRKLHLIVLSLLAVVFVGTVAVHSAQAATVAPRKALLERINVVRARYGRAHVRTAPRLRVAAQRHSVDMLHRNYFAHTSPTGSSVYTRIAGSGFVSGYTWIGGETLAWGTGTLAGARATVYAWMHSPEHRAILLSPRFRWVGINRQCGRYHGFARACVWTADWVTRS